MVAATRRNDGERKTETATIKAVKKADDADHPGATELSSSSSSKSGVNNGGHADSNNKRSIVLKDLGNTYFSQKNYSEAVSSYLEGLKAMKNDDKVLQVSLRSNLAMTYLKLEDYKEAEKECTIVIENYDSKNTKVWYRRALAREKIFDVKKKEMENKKTSTADIPGTTVEEDALLVLRGAIDDLEASLKLLNTKQQSQEKKTVQLALDRLLNKQKKVVDKQQHPKEKENNGTSSQNGVTGHNMTKQQKEQLQNPSPVASVAQSGQQIPSPKQQRQDIIRLLMSRKMGLQKNANGSLKPPVGEAFFLIDWKWWCRWSYYVDFFYWDEGQADQEKEKEHQQEGKNGGPHQTRVLQLLLQGSVLPTKNKRKRSEEDDDASTSTEDSQQSDDTYYYGGPPGPIDNKKLFLSSLTEQSASSTQGTFYRQWYQHHNNYQGSNNNNSTEANGSSPSPPLRPNLVRGYHFELLPREVYCALQSWYGETTPPVCRRTVLVEKKQQSAAENGNNNNASNQSVVIQLYPLENTSVIANRAAICAACRARYATARCKRCLSVHYCDRACQESHWPFHKARCKEEAAALADGEKNTSSNKMAITTGEEFYSYKDDHLGAGGKVGLNNLGNTCFMNSALQCLSHATPLTRHFLSSKFREDLNTSNPLGTGGRLANAYDSLIKEIWMRTKNIGGSMSPTALKRSIALFAPRFAGCLQHDSQEFLAYLLDGLHEDLNRIRKAPYVEMPDATDRQNMAIAAAEAWDAHRRRNDSLVMDTFYGQFKSTCVCPRCSRVSVSFDAFNHVSLEIPQLRNTTITVPVLLFRAVGKTNDNGGSNGVSRIPVRYGVLVRPNNILGDVKSALSNLCGIPPTRLILCEVFDNAIVEIMQDNKPVTSIRANDIITAYEVDPYTNDWVHVIASHKLLPPNSSKLESPTNLQSASSLDQQDEEQKVDSPESTFGFPLLTSFDSGLTCRDVWDHIWKLVRHMVVEEMEADKSSDTSDKVDVAESGDDDIDLPFKSLLQIRVVNNEGAPLSVFPLIIPGDSLNETEIRRTSILPPTHDEKIIHYLGEGCTSRFLFISLEWIDRQVLPTSESDDPSSNEVEAVSNDCDDSTTKGYMIQESRFLAYEDHHSLIDAIQKQRAMNGMKGVTLDQCFDAFTKPERLDEHNMWYCSRCKEHVRALKTMELWTLPNILVVHLKRFEFRQGFRRDKLDTFVDFPLNGLNMSEHCNHHHGGATDSSDAVDSLVADQVPAIYDLFGVVNHYGRMGFGHYTAFARRWDEAGIAEDWNLFDDSSVRNIGRGDNADGVVTPAAYILFYRRRIFN